MTTNTPQAKYNLPFKWKPENLDINAMLLNETSIMNMILTYLLDKHIPSNKYTVNKLGSANVDGGIYVVYTNTSDATDTSFPPVLVEVQAALTQKTMVETIERSTELFGEFKLLPVVLVIACEPWENDDDLNYEVDDDLHLFTIESNFWAKKCYIYDKYAFETYLEEKLNSTALIPLCQFISDQNKTFCLSHKEDTNSISLNCKTKYSSSS